MRAAFFLLLLPAAALAQTAMRSTVTLATGFAHDAGDTCCGDSVPSFAASYAYRFLPHLALEIGLHSTLSLHSEQRGANYDFKTDDRYLWLPFGLKGILPVANGRLELSAGAGGAFEKYLAGGSGFFLPRSGWGGYASTEAALSLDRKRHFWISASPRLFFANTNQGYSHDRWFVFNLGFGFRF